MQFVETCHSDSRLHTQFISICSSAAENTLLETFTSMCYKRTDGTERKNETAIVLQDGSLTHFSLLVRLTLSTGYLFDVLEEVY